MQILGNSTSNLGRTAVSTSCLSGSNRFYIYLQCSMAYDTETTPVPGTHELLPGGLSTFSGEWKR